MRLYSPASGGSGVNLGRTCFLEPAQKLLSDHFLQVEVVVVLIGALQVRRDVLEDQDVFGLGFLNTWTSGLSIIDWGQR